MTTEFNGPSLRVAQSSIYDRSKATSPVNPDRMKSRLAKNGIGFSGWSRQAVIAMAFVLPLMCLILLSPRPPREQESLICVKTYDITGPFHVVLNCDSYEFMVLARNPGMLLTDAQRKWQSRPIYPLLGYFAAVPFRVGRWLSLAGMGSPDVRRDVTPVESRPVNRLFNNLISEYLGYTTINLALIVVALILFCRLITRGGPVGAWLLFPAAMLVINEVSKAFFWSPHLQIFNIFHPIVSIEVSRRLVADRSRSLKNLALIGMALGLASLAYGAFLVTVAAAALTILIVGRENPGYLNGRVLPIISVVLSAAIPVLLWIGLVRLVCGSFYSHETQAYHQFVWVIEAWQAGWANFQVVTFRHLADFYIILSQVSIFPLTVTAILRIVSGMLVSRSNEYELPEFRNVSIALACYLLAAVPFYVLMGVYFTRLEWCLTVPLIILAGLELQRIALITKRRLPAMVSAAAAAAYIAFWILTSGPYS